MRGSHASEIDQIKSWFNDDPLDRTNTINPQIVWSKARSKYYSSKAARVLSVPQIIFGIVSIITQSCALGARMGYFGTFGSGIWCGAVVRVLILLLFACHRIIVKSFINEKK